MDDPNMTMEEYIKFEEEKARRRGRVFNWQTATYGKIRVDYDLYDLRSMEAEFPAIVINDAVAPQDELQLVPSCFVIFDLEPLSLSFDFIQETLLGRIPAQSVGSSNTYVLDLPCLLVLITGTSQSRQHVDTSLIHIESRKSPTAVLFDDDTGRISIRHCEY
ncbi:hypothetical protein Tco_0876948 [Tanacetum coccineum]|uniref:Uncharacterized protein n=1 Tax=Tanacetum coccineum TaxID=301880 RepID=A0ABQ5BWM9_9ASTR